MRKWDKVRVHVGKWVKWEKIKNRETNRKEKGKGKEKERTVSEEKDSGEESMMLACAQVHKTHTHIHS